VNTDMESGVGDCSDVFSASPPCFAERFDHLCSAGAWSSDSVSSSRRGEPDLLRRLATGEAFPTNSFFASRAKHGVSFG
jgi:hypothetical protein